METLTQNQQAPTLIIAETTAPKVAKAISKCPPEGRDVLNAYLCYGLDNPANPRIAPSSRKLRRLYAQRLSRRQFAKGIRQLIGLGLLVPVEESGKRALLIAIPATASSCKERGGKTCQ